MCFLFSFCCSFLWHRSVLLIFFIFFVVLCVLFDLILTVWYFCFFHFILCLVPNISCVWLLHSVYWPFGLLYRLFRRYRRIPKRTWARITRIFKTPWSKIMFFRGVNISCFIYTYMEHGVKYLFCVMYCRSLFVPLIFCFVHCAVYPSSINGFWIPLWYLQAYIEEKTWLDSV